MFRVFSKFNPLFFRPRIRAAISEFQADLIKSVREAVHMLQVRTPTYMYCSADTRAHLLLVWGACGGALQAKFTDRYEQSEARVTAALRDMPPVAGQPTRVFPPPTAWHALTQWSGGDVQARSCGPGRSSGSCGS